MSKASKPQTEQEEPFGIEPGDIFCCWGTDRISRLISVKTSLGSLLRGPSGLRYAPSHVAIACPRYAPHNQQQFWVESTTLAHRKCLERQKNVRGCQVHHIPDRIRDYTGCGGHVDVYRLTPINGLTGHQVSELRQDLIGWFVRHEVGYDAASAIFSGTKLLKSMDKALPFWAPGAQSVFCSQLIAAELQALGLMNRDSPVRYNPGRLMRMLVRQGVYGRVASFRSPRDPRLDLL